MKKISVYDTTLRDGSQGEGISFTLADKLSIAHELDRLGVHYIEGGYPNANPKDKAFFKAIKKEKFKNAKIAAFGATRKARSTAGKDATIKALLGAQTPVVTLVGKTWDLHVTDALRVSFDENCRMVADSVGYLKKRGREVIFDAEHFFDGYKNNPEYALKVLQVAQDHGADLLCLCDTNGGALPTEISSIVAAVKKSLQVGIGIHTHNDSNMAVANTIMAVEAGAEQIQGTINGFGERCGNADLCSIIPALELKRGYRCLGKKNLKHLTNTALFLYDITNIVPPANQPFVGQSAFAHKGGLHVSGVQKNSTTYEHVQPESVGNNRRILISELSGRATVLAKTRKYDLNRHPDKMKLILKQMQDLENKGYSFEAAEASFHLLVRKAMQDHRTFFELHGFRVIVENRDDGKKISEATIKIKVKDTMEHTAAEGDGPVDALNTAIRKALLKYYPQLQDVHLIDFKVRIIDGKQGTAAVTRVIIESRDRNEVWSTVGVSENLIEASWIALVDSIEYKLLKSHG